MRLAAYIFTSLKNQSLPGNGVTNTTLSENGPAPTSFCAPTPTSYTAPGISPAMSASGSVTLSSIHRVPITLYLTVYRDMGLPLARGGVQVTDVEECVVLATTGGRGVDGIPESVSNKNALKLKLISVNYHSRGSAWQ